MFYSIWNQFLAPVSIEPFLGGTLNMYKITLVSISSSAALIFNLYLIYYLFWPILVYEMNAVCYTNKYDLI